MDSAPAFASLRPRPGMTDAPIKTATPAPLPRRAPPCPCRAHIGVHAKPEQRFDLPRRAHHLIDVDVADGGVPADVVLEIALRLRGHAVARADEVRDQFRFQLALRLLHARARRHIERGIIAEVTEKEMRQLMRERCELHRRRMVLVDLQAIARRRLARRPHHADGARRGIARVDPAPVDIVLLRARHEARHALGLDGTVREKRGGIRRQRLSLGVVAVIDERHRAERPQDKERPRALLGRPAEALLPVERRGSKAQPRLLHLQQHGVERREIAQPGDEFKEREVIPALRIEARLGDELIEQRSRCVGGEQIVLLGQGGQVPWARASWCAAAASAIRPLPSLMVRSGAARCAATRLEP